MKTVKLIVLFFTALCLNLFPVRAAGVGTLFLVSATYGAGATVPVLLYRVGPGSSGALTAAEKIADSCDRVLVDYDRASLVVAYPPLVPNTFAVLDMKTGSRSRAPSLTMTRTTTCPATPFTYWICPERVGARHESIPRIWRRYRS